MAGNLKYKAYIWKKLAVLIVHVRASCSDHLNPWSYYSNNILFIAQHLKIIMRLLFLPLCSPILFSAPCSVTSQFLYPSLNAVSSKWHKAWSECTCYIGYAECGTPLKGYAHTLVILHIFQNKRRKCKKEELCTYIYIYIYIYICMLCWRLLILFICAVDVTPALQSVEL